jgi:uncharacterized protein involved in exopolysaccharide biosynthesis
MPESSFSPAVVRPQHEPPDTLPLLRLLDLVLRYRSLVLLVTLAIAALVTAWAGLRPLPWTADSRFMPAGNSGRDAAGLRGIAGQFGFDLSAMDSGEPLEFYVELVRSPDLLRELVHTEFNRGGAGAGPTRLMDLLAIPGETEAERTLNAIRDMQEKRVVVSLHKQAGLVNLTTLAPSAELAAAMNRRLLELVGEFNLDKRQSQAREERRFTEARLDAARRELAEAETARRRFMEQNRQIRSPQLMMEHDRLERQVAMVQQVYTSLAQTYEQARINEVRNTPILTIIDQPESMVRLPSRRMPLFVVAGTLLGFTAALSLVLVLWTLDRQLGSSHQQYPELDRIYRALRRHRRPALPAG